MTTVVRESKLDGAACLEPDTTDTPPQHRPLPPHPLAFAPEFVGEDYDTFEKTTLAEWGLTKEAFGPEPHHWRNNLRRTWNEAVEDIISGKRTPLRFALLKQQVKPPAPNGRSGILGQQIEKAAFLEAHPEVLSIEIEPIIVVGQNRTGTTLLHRLLSLDNNARCPKAWELKQPIPPPEEGNYGIDVRIAKARLDTESINTIIPDLQYYHEIDFTMPQECLFAMNGDIEMGHCINTPGAPVHRLLDSTEMESVYIAHKKTLQILSSKFPAKSHWVLKCPSHLPHLQTIVRLFPKARFLWTHRHMEEVVSSFCRLSSVFAVLSLPSLTPAVMGQHILQYYAHLIDKGLSQRDELDDENRFVDVMYKNLVDDPISQVRRVYERFQLSFTEEFEEKLVAYLQEDSVKRAELAKTAPPRPSLEEYGLDSKVVEDAFAKYHDRYLATSVKPDSM